MYRSSSPFAPPPDHTPQSYSPAAGSVVPGSVTYTTSTGSDGRVIYHPFKAVPASYQTPKGIVSGIQWVPAEATQIIPAGAQPANSDFAASWSRGHLGKDDQRALKEWQRDEEKRRRKEEKDSSKRLREQGLRGDAEYELRKARERDAQSAMVRERRKSFNAGGAGAMPGSVTFPVPGNAGYPTANSPGYPSSPYTGGASSYIPSGTAPSYPRDRKYSSGISDLDRQLGGLDLNRGKDHGGGEGGVNSLGRPRKYSTSEPGGGDRTRAISGNFGARIEGYGIPGPYTPATGPYSSSNAKAYSSATAGTGHYPVATGIHYTNASQNIRASPNMRAGEAPFVPPFSSGYPGSSYSSSPARAPDQFPRSTSPFPGAGPQVYPRGHVMEGQPMLPRSRATTPIPGAPGPGSIGGSYSQVVPLGFQQPNASPRMPVAFPGEQPQLAAPECFSRPINAAQPYTPFPITKVDEMDDVLDESPKMPHMLQLHDVFGDDWNRFINDLSLAWSGKLPVPELTRGIPPKRSTLAADLIDLWNTSFFLVRGVEVVLFRGRERRTGQHAGTIDQDLPGYHNDDDSSSSLSEDSDSDDYVQRPATGLYGVYGRNQQTSDVYEASRRRREARAERKRRRREKKLRRKEKAREKKYSLYLTCLSPGGAGGPGMGMPGGFTAMPAGPGAGNY